MLSFVTGGEGLHADTPLPLPIPTPLIFYYV